MKKIFTLSSLALLFFTSTFLFFHFSPIPSLSESSEETLSAQYHTQRPEIQAPKKTVESRARFADERLRFEYNMLKDPVSGKIPPQAKQMALAQAQRIPQLTSSTRGAGFTVTPRGPNNFGGRTRALTFDVRYATNNTIMAGGVSSGVFRSTNGGLSWAKVSSNNDIHNVTSIAQDPRPGQQNTWYYVTGEIFGNSASLGSAYRGNGVW
ncbi:MAG: hypothetical protein AAFP02_19040 [Bacteroidota bacterium]